ncbi:MAG: hypothetical protein IIA67_01130 [Planctomycetes bacterium]|nr:hypothetical protein [Planctomycetota bacterium]
MIAGTQHVGGLNADEAIKSEVLSLSFRIVDGEPRPRIEVRHDDGRTWLA